MLKIAKIAEITKNNSILLLHMFARELLWLDKKLGGWVWETISFTEAILRSTSTMPSRRERDPLRPPPTHDDDNCIRAVLRKHVRARRSRSGGSEVVTR